MNQHEHPLQPEELAESFSPACERAMCLSNAELATALRHDLEHLMRLAAAQIRMPETHSPTERSQIAWVCDHAADMVHQLSQHLERLSKPLAMASAVNVGDALRSTTEIYRVLLDEADATVTWDQDLPELVIVPEHLDALLSRLLHNSILFSLRRPLRVHLGGRVEEGSRQMIFSDDGNGVSPSGLRAMFRPFVHLHQSEYAGVGLGLTTCRAICRTVRRRYVGRQSRPGVPDHLQFWSR